MSWEEVPTQRGKRSRRDTWSVTVTKTGARIYIPDDVVLPDLQVSTHFGKADDAGWVKLVFEPTGARRVNVDKHNKIQRNISYSRLPFMPSKVAMTAVEVKSRPDEQAYILRIPWMGLDGKPVPRQHFEAL